MDITMDPTLALRVHPHEELALEVRVNFGLHTGRNATPAEIDDLARSLRTYVQTFTVTAEERHQFGDAVETSLHQVVIAVERQNAGELSDDVCERILELAGLWAAACIESRSELGELAEPEL